MPVEPESTTAVGLFASTCEQLNEYARQLRNEKRFSNIRTDCDIREYGKIWTLEKWIEAELNPEESIWACWWLELKPHNDGWLIESNLSISPALIHISLYDTAVDNIDSLKNLLLSATHDLRTALDSNPAFREAIRAHQK